jgi:ubiquinone/menaquinone biosynthesis C-methylase UbiE
MDASAMTYESNAFDVVLDKGALDAIASDDSDDVTRLVDRVFSEVARVTRPNGRYVVVSLAQDHVLARLLAFFTQPGWEMQVHRIELDDLCMLPLSSSPHHHLSLSLSLCVCVCRSLT